jgi:hypothetical protein
MAQQSRPASCTRKRDMTTHAAAASHSLAVRSLALPVEHGGWGFLAEPVILGLALAPSSAGAGLGLAALGAFLARHPLKLAAADWRKRARHPRTARAEGLALAYALAALVSLGTAFATARFAFWLPLALAAPLGLLQLSYDARNRGRDLVPELAGAAALGSVASAVVLAGGWTQAPALALWLLMAARAVASVLYIRARLRLDRGQRPGLAPTWLSHMAGLAFALGLAALGWAPWLAVLAFAVLLSRAAHGLSPLRRPARPQIVGFREMGFGLLTAALLAFGYALRL